MPKTAYFFRLLLARYFQCRVLSILGAKENLTPALSLSKEREPDKKAIQSLPQPPISYHRWQQVCADHGLVAVGHDDAAFDDVL